MISRKTLMVFLKGLAMGAADSIPGVSGGTIAFITNIYDELLDSIASVNPGTLTILKDQGLGAVWKHVNGNFLLPLLCGILVSLVSTANLVVYLLSNHYTYLMCSFIGLILASLWLVGKNFGSMNLNRIILAFLGAVMAISLALMPQFQGAESLAYYFLCGAVAICAMILPGISGAFILLLLGGYAPVLEALTGLNLPVILVFVSGCLVGLLSFSRLLSWLLHTRRQSTMAFLLGILAGSLYSLWPWRRLLPCESGDKACAAGQHAFHFYKNEAIQALDIVTGQPISLTWCVMLLAAGVLLVLGIEQLALKFTTLSNSSGV